MNFAVEDKLDTPKFNRILWTGTMGDLPYPSLRSGIDLRKDRPALLEAWTHAHTMPVSAQTDTKRLPQTPRKTGGAE